MDGIEFRAIRNQLGLNRDQFARLIGYTGNTTNNKTQMRRYENGDRQIPLYIARLAWLIGEIHAGRDRITRNQFGIINWPYWSGYVFDSEPDDAGGKEGTDD